MTNIGKHLAQWGTALTISLLIGPAATIYGMIKTASEMRSESPQIEFLAHHMSIALYATLAGIVLAHIGGLLLLVALCGVKYRAPWFEIVMWVIACLWMLLSFASMMEVSAISSIPAIIDMIAGIAVMVYLARHNREFAAQPAEPQLAGS